MPFIFKYTNKLCYLSTNLDGTQILSVFFTFLIYLFLKEEQWIIGDHFLTVVLLKIQVC
jgi:hypothetical protein